MDKDAAATQQEVEAANAQYRELIKLYIERAEKVLNVPVGTLAKIEEDKGVIAVMKMSTAVEPLLRQALGDLVRRKVEHPKVATGRSEALIKAIEGSGLDHIRTVLLEFDVLDQRESQFIDALFRVRNHYAHDIRNFHLSIFEIGEKIAAPPNPKDPLIHKKLLGFSESLKGENSGIVFALLSHWIYFNFARVLHTLAHVVEPPPRPPATPPAGLLGDLLFPKPQ